MVSLRAVRSVPLSAKKPPEDVCRTKKSGALKGSFFFGFFFPRWGDLICAWRIFFFVARGAKVAKSGFNKVGRRNGWL